LERTRLLTGYFLSGAHSVDAAVDVGAVLSVADLAAITDRQAVLSAESPDRVLHKAWEETRIPTIELSGIDLSGNSHQRTAAAGAIVTLRPVMMRSL
jgi:hypothetical protein